MSIGIGTDIIFTAALTKHSLIRNKNGLETEGTVFIGNTKEMNRI